MALTQTPVNTFVGGLITEASPLNFPENASSDELNCELNRDGSRQRRRGIEYESGFAYSSFTVDTTAVINTGTWENPAGQSSTQFLWVQVGDTLYFWDKSGSAPSTNQKSFSVDLGSFTSGTGLIVQEYPIYCKSIKGRLVVVSPAIDSFLLEYDEDLDTISATLIDFYVRDFDWQGTVTEYYGEVGSASAARQYDTYNAGWTLAARTAFTGWPPLTHPWFAGKNATNDFDIAEWRKIYGGNTLQGNGHYILNFFNKDRAQAVLDDPEVATAVSISTETENARISCVASFAGRAWYSGINSSKNGSVLLFSKVIENNSDFGRCFQEADPTAEDYNDLVDSDGGAIFISGASKIKTMYEWAGSLLVFAENGVWQISGRDGIFKATEFSVNRVTGADGLTNINTLVDAEGNPVWWAKSGIYTMEKDQVSLEGRGNNISALTVQTFWENIGAGNRDNARGYYDTTNKRILWLYGTDTTQPNKFTKVLLYDIALGAYFPWTFGQAASTPDYPVGAEFFDGRGSQEVTENVTENTVVVNVNGSPVTVTSTQSLVNDQTDVRFIVRDGGTGQLTFATVTSTDFLDWGSVDFSSYAETNYSFGNSLATRKSNVYVVTYLARTETGFTGDDVSGYNPTNESSCKLSAYWDLKNVGTTPKEVYRLRRPVVVDTGDLNSFDYEYDSVVTRNKLRGRGTNVKLRFESTTGKDFKLQGYEVINAEQTSL